VTERRVGGIDPVALEIIVHRGKNGAPCRRQEMGRAAIRTEHARQRFRRLRPDTAERTEFAEKAFS